MTPPQITNDLIHIKKLVESARTIVLATHENPDGDGLGAMLAFSHFLNTINAPHVLYVSGVVPRHLSFLAGFEKLTTGLSFDVPDLVIGFDYGELARLRLPYTIPRTYTFITLDHHPKADQEGDVCITETSLSSTCELVYNFFTANNICITPEVATCLYTGIIADTGGFVHNNTTSNTFAVAEQLLLSAPINTALITKKLFGFSSLNSALVTGLALSRLVVDTEARIAYTYISWRDCEQYNIAWEDIDIIINLVNNITDERVQCVAVFKEKNDGMTAVSFRSDASKGFDVRAVATTLGGGGHRFATAAKIQGTCQEVIQRVLKEMKQN